MCELCESPRQWDNLGTMYCWLRSYHSPDRTTYPDVFEFLMEYIPTGSPYYDEGMDIFPSREYQYKMESYLDKAELIWLPVYKYEHSGICFNTTGYSCQFDSGQCGYIFVTKEAIRKEYGVRKISSTLKQTVLDVLASEVEMYSNWSDGECHYDEDMVA